MQRLRATVALMDELDQLDEALLKKVQTYTECIDFLSLLAESIGERRAFLLAIALACQNYVLGNQPPERIDSWCEMVKKNLARRKQQNAPSSTTPQ